jgi:hypothetical protein
VLNNLALYRYSSRKGFEVSPLNMLILKGGAFILSLIFCVLLYHYTGIFLLK